MRLIIIALITLITSTAPTLTTFTIAGNLTPEQEKRLIELRAKSKAGKDWQLQKEEFKKSLAKGSEGRFKATRISDSGALILDTKEGHLSIWGSDGTVSVLMYQGQIFPGKKMGDILYRSDQK